jgi:hypothetical protein
MKTFILAFIISASAFAAEEGDIIRETWTCKNDEVNFTAVFTPKISNARITAFGAENIELTGETSILDAGLVIKLNGSLYEHDTWNFEATLVRSDEAFEWSEKKKVTAKAQLSLVTEMFIDCVGNRASVDVIDCSVVIERK